MLAAQVQGPGSPVIILVCRRLQRDALSTVGQGQLQLRPACGWRSGLATTATRAIAPIRRSSAAVATSRESHC